MDSAAVQAAGPVVEKFAATGGRLLGVAFGGLLVVVGLYGIVTDPAGTREIALASFALAALAAVTLVRPVVTAHGDGLLLRNMLRDTFLPWSIVERCKVSQTLQVATTEGQFHGLGVTRSARSMMRSSRPEGTGSRLGFLGMGMRSYGDQDLANPSRRANEEVVGGSYTEYVESRIAQLAAQHRPQHGDAPPRVVTAWAPVPVAGLVLAAACTILAVV